MKRLFLKKEDLKMEVVKNVNIVIQILVTIFKHLTHIKN